MEGFPSAPALRLDALDGAAVELVADERPAVIHFFATWCEPCRTELPALAAFARGGGASGSEARGGGVRLLLVDVAEPADRVRRFFAERAAPGAVLLDRDRAAARAWGVSLLPASFVVISGRLHLAREGEVDWAAPATRAAILPRGAVPSIKSQGGPTQ